MKMRENIAILEFLLGEDRTVEIVREITWK